MATNDPASIQRGSARAASLDPTGLTDSTTALQEMFDVPGESVTIPHGTYLIGTDTPLILPSNKTIRGQGREVTILKPAGGIHIPISSWSVDTSFNPPILTVNLATTPFSTGNLWSPQFQQQGSAMTVTQSSVSAGTATIAYMLYAGNPPAVAQYLSLAKMATLPANPSGLTNGYNIATVTPGATVDGVQTGTLTFAVSGVADYTPISETGLAVTNFTGTDPTSSDAVLASFIAAAGSATSGGAPTYAFEGMPNFGTYQVDYGGPASLMLPATYGELDSGASTFYLAVKVPSGATTSGTAGYWIITSPAVIGFDTRSGQSASNFTVRDLSFIGDASPTASPLKQAFSAFPILIQNSAFSTQALYDGNFQFLNVGFENLAGVAAIWIQANNVLLQGLSFKNISCADIEAFNSTNLTIRDVISEGTGWSGANTLADNGYCVAVNVDVSVGGSNILIDNYAFKPAIGSTVGTPLAFGINANPKISASALPFNSVTIQNCVVDVTGLVLSLNGGKHTGDGEGEFFTGGGVNKLLFQNNQAIGYPLTAEIAGNDIRCVGNQGMSFAVAFKQDELSVPQFSRLEFTGNILTVASDYAPNIGHSTSMFTFPGGTNGDDYSCNFDRIRLRDNHMTVVWDTNSPSTTVPDFIAHFASFGDGESGPGCTFTDCAALDNTMLFVNARPNTNNEDDMFSIHTPIVGSTGLLLSNNRSIGESSGVRHLLLSAGAVFALLKVDGDETCNPTGLFFDISGGTGTGTLTNGSAVVTLAAAIATFAVGQIISGVGISPGTTIAALSGTSLTLSQPATVSGSSVTLSTALGTTMPELWHIRSGTGLSSSVLEVVETVKSNTLVLTDTTNNHVYALQMVNGTLTTTLIG